MTSTLPPIDHGRRRLLTAFIPPVLIIGVLWIVFAFDRVFHLDLYRLGIAPRELSGLMGIVTSPFVHANQDHLFNNTVPILILGWFLVYFYPKAAWRVMITGWFAEGLWVWTVARGDTYHIGASGVVYAIAGFLFASGFLRRKLALIAVSLIVVYLYGSLWWGMLPLVPHVSWESHLFGGIAGVWLAWYYRSVPPAHVPEPVVLEDEEDEPTVAFPDVPPGVWPHGSNTSTTFPMWPDPTTTEQGPAKQ